MSEVVQPMLCAMTPQIGNASSAWQTRVHFALHSRSPMVPRSFAGISESSQRRLGGELICCMACSRFRYTDGQWYSGRVVSSTNHVACVEFQYPIRPFMLGARLEVPSASLQPGSPAQQSASASVGERVLAADGRSGLWLPAEVTHPRSAEGCVQVLLPRAFASAVAC